MIAGALALAAAVVLASSSVLTKRLVGSLPHRQLIAPLLLLNAALLAPWLITVHWHGGRDVLLLQGLSGATLAVGSFCIFDLFSQGSATAVAVAQAMAPMPALIFSLLLLAARVGDLQAAGAVVVTVGVLGALGPVFGDFSRIRAVAMVAVAATTSGLLLVLTKLLADRGVGLVEIYVTRTTLGGLAWLILAPPRHVPVGALPQLVVRSALQTLYFVLLIAAVERGSPPAVQTLAATTPLMLLAAGILARRERPSARLAGAAVAVVLGVALAVA